MKKLLATAAAALMALVATPTTAEAGVHLKIGSSRSYVSGHASCGCPIYTKRVVRGFDSYRRPIYNYYRQPFRHSRTHHFAHSNRSSFRSHHVNSSFSRSRGYSGRSSYRGGYSRGGYRGGGSCRY